MDLTRLTFPLAGPIDGGQLRDELVAAGVPVFVTDTGSGGVSIGVEADVDVIEVIVTDEADEGVIQAVIDDHVPAEPT